MTDDLQRVFRGRADRAPAPNDLDHTVDLVAAHAEQHARRHRNRLAVASGAAVVVAAATVAVAVADSGAGNTASSGTTRSVAAGALGTARPSPEPDWVVVHSHGRWVRRYLTPLTATSPPTRVPLPATSPQLQRSLAARAAKRARQRLVAHKRANAASHAGGSLRSIDPAPKKAEISLGLVPKGFEYLSHDTANTYYGLPGTPPGDYFSSGIVVDVHQFVGDIKNYTCTVNGKPASYAKSGGFTIVRVLYSKHVDVGFQAPPSAHLTKAQALKMAAGLDVRSTENRTHG